MERLPWFYVLVQYFRLPPSMPHFSKYTQKSGVAVTWSMQLSVVEEKPFTSSVNMRSEAPWRQGRGRKEEPLTILFPSWSVDMTFKDDVTVILLLSVFFMGWESSGLISSRVVSFSYLHVAWKGKNCGKLVNWKICFIGILQQTLHDIWPSPPTPLPLTKNIPSKIHPLIEPCQEGGGREGDQTHCLTLRRYCDRESERAVSGWQRPLKFL